MNKKHLLVLCLFIFITVIFFIISLSRSTPLLEVTPTPANTQILATPTLLPTQTEVPREINYYVSPSGDNSNPGSLNKPWQTIQHAVDQVLPGDTIYIQGGTYQESVRISISGELNRPITLMNFNDKPVTIEGGDKPAITGEADSWVIKNLQLDSAADRTLRITASYWKIQKNKIIGSVNFWGNNNTFEDNEVDGSQHKGNENGVEDNGPSSHHNLIKGNYIHDFSSRGIWSQWLTHDDVFESNHVSNMSGEQGICIDMDAATNVTYRHVVRGNIVHDCGQTGIELENSYASLIENNFVYNCGLEGITAINYPGCTAGGDNNEFGDANGECRGDILNTIIQQNLIINGGRVGGIVSYDAAGVKLYNNTVSASAAGFYIKGDAKFSNNWDVQGNIFAHNTRVQVSVEDPKSFVADKFNLVYRPKGNNVYEIRRANSTFFSLQNWQDLYKLGEGSIESDPMFIDLATNNFHLQPDSPAVDSGTNLNIQMDIEGKPRPAGLNYDMGVYER
jgi:parallel beta-helix repeat protein